MKTTRPKRFPPGCVCLENTWFPNAYVPRVCARFEERFEGKLICSKCEHDRGCHKLKRGK